MEKPNGKGLAPLGVPPAIVRRDVPLARMATVRTGGSAEWFARVGGVRELRELLAWAQAMEMPVAVVGSGSNLLIADEGVTGLVVKLEGELAKIERDGPTSIGCGGGARLPAVAARAAQAGLSGIEFGVNIPGTVGGAVKMNANAYGGELARVLEWVEIVTPGGVERRAPQQLGFGYRSSNVGPEEIVARALLSLRPAPVQQVKATLADMRARRHEAQPQGIKTFGSTFKNPDYRNGPEDRDGRQDGQEDGPQEDPQDRPLDGLQEDPQDRPRDGPQEGPQDSPARGRTAGQLLSEAGCNGLAVGGARFAPKHANFIENMGDATTADVVAVMAEGRRRVLEMTGIALEPEVQTLGPVRFPWVDRR